MEHKSDSSCSRIRDTIKADHRDYSEMPAAHQWTAPDRILAPGFV